MVGRIRGREMERAGGREGGRGGRKRPCTEVVHIVTEGMRRCATKYNIT